MTRVSRARAARAFLAIAALSAAWALVVAATGGVAIDDAPIRLSSRSPRNPAIIATASAALAWLLASAAERRAAWVAAQRFLTAAAGAIVAGVNRLHTWTAPALAAGLS